jgi:hypothetical protein
MVLLTLILRMDDVGLRKIFSHESPCLTRKMVKRAAGLGGEIH